MITERLHKVFAYRVWISSWFCCYPYTWDWKRNKIKKSGFYSFATWLLVFSGLFAFELILIIRTIIRVFGDEFNIFHVMMEVSLIVVIWTVLICAILVLRSRDGFLSWINQLFHIDRKFQGKNDFFYISIQPSFNSKLIFQKG